MARLEIKVKGEIPAELSHTQIAILTFRQYESVMRIPFHGKYSKMAAEAFARKSQALSPITNVWLTFIAQ